MASLEVPVYGIRHDFLGNVKATATGCGDTIWPQACELGAKAYGLDKSAIVPAGVKLGDQVLGLEAASKVPLSKLVSESAEWLVAPPAGTPSSMECHFMARMDELQKELGKHAKHAEAQDERAEAQDERAEAQDKRVQELQEQLEEQKAKIEKINTVLLHPLCRRQMCLDAAEFISVRGNRKGSGRRSSTSDAPHWATKWLEASGGSVNLTREDLTVIWASVPGTIRGEGNAAAHSVQQQDQAAAVHALADDAKRASLVRIYEFVHSHTP